MSGGFYLDDGREIWRSSLAICGGLSLISRHARESDFLWRYLFDKSRKCNPFLSLDVRLLTENDQQVFWRAVNKAYAELVGIHGIEGLEAPNSYSYRFLHDLVAAHIEIKAGVIVPDASNKVRDYLNDLDQIWLSNEELDAEYEKYNKSLIDFRSKLVPRRK